MAMRHRQVNYSQHPGAICLKQRPYLIDKKGIRTHTASIIQHIDVADPCPNNIYKIRMIQIQTDRIIYHLDQNYIYLYLIIFIFIYLLYFYLHLYQSHCQSIYLLLSLFSIHIGDRNQGPVSGSTHSLRVT